VLEAASLGAINVHASLLPRWRGAAPIQRAILAGDSDTGVSIMRMEAGLDTGPYCLQRSTPIADKNAAELTAELAQIGAAALTEALPAIEDGSAHWVVQDEALVTYAQKVAKSDLLLLPELPTVDALRRIRSSMPAAPSRMRVADRGVTVVSAERSESTLAPGVVACSKRLLEAGFADGALTLTRVKPDGKAEMDGAAWARGIPDLNESSWGAPS
jgi:methionyl-tRNA formyltransferase